MTISMKKMSVKYSSKMSMKVTKKDIDRNLKLLLNDKPLDIPLAVLNQHGFYRIYMNLALKKEKNENKLKLSPLYKKI